MWSAVCSFFHLGLIPTIGEGKFPPLLLLSSVAGLIIKSTQDRLLTGEKETNVNSYTGRNGT